MKIALLGPFGYGNLGDAAIQQSIISALRERLPGVELFGISLNPDDTLRRHGLPTFPLSWLPSDVPEGLERFVTALIRRVSKTRFERLGYIVGRIFRRLPVEWRFWMRTFRYVGDLDVIILSGGGQIDDYWGGPWSLPFNLLRWTFLARLRGCKVLVVSVGAGPLDTRLGRVFTRLYLSMANYRSYRDAESKQFLLGLGFSVSNDPVFPDLAHSISVRELKERPMSNNAVLRVGIGPLVYFHPDVWPTRDWDIYRDYVRKMVVISEGVLSRGYSISFFPGEEHYDRFAIDDILKSLRESGHGGERLRAAAISSVNELLFELQMCDVVITSRFHGVMLAHALSKPVLAISYHQKIATLMMAVGQGAFCVDIEDFSPEGVLQRLDSLIRYGEKLKEAIDRVEKDYRAQLDEQYNLILRIIQA